LRWASARADGFRAAVAQGAYPSAVQIGSEAFDHVKNRSELELWGKMIPLLVAIGLEALIMVLLIRI
jgi:hypothetical protein